MDADQSVEREKLVSDDELDDPPKATLPAVVTSTPQASTAVLLMTTMKGTSIRKVSADPEYREPTVVIVNNAMQQKSSSTASTSAAPAIATPGSSSGGAGKGLFSMTTSGETSRSQNSTKSHRNSTAGDSSTQTTTARLVFVNERSGSVQSSSKTNTASEKTVKSRKVPRETSPSILPPRPPPPSTLLHHNKHSKSTPTTSSATGLNSFSERGLKHHSFISEVPDVRRMEQTLLGLLDDFHSGKLRAFGSGTMDQMTDIREQQERLAKLHFELGGAVQNMMADESSPEDESIAQENMTKLVKQLEKLSVSIEGLNSDAL